MNAAYGIGLLAATVLLIAWAYGQYRRPSASAWTESETMTVALTLVIVWLLVWGLAYLAKFIGDLAAETRWLEDIAVAGIALVLCWILVPRLMASARRTPEPSLEEALPEPANDPHPKSPSKSGRSAGRPDRRRAA